MKILLAYTLRDSLSLRRPLSSLADIHIGLSYVSAFLKARQHETRLVVLSSEMARRSLALLDAAVSEFDPRVIGFTAVSTQYPFVAEAARLLKAKSPARKVLIGGVHASLQPEAVIQDSFDAVCINEGEIPTAAYVEQLENGHDPQGIRNLWIRRPDGSVEKNPTREFIPNLDELPPPDREMWQTWVRGAQFANHVVMPSRGCPYNCAYCSNHALRKLAPGKYVRLRSPDEIVREIQDLRSCYPATEEIYLQSETIAINPNWLEQLASGIQVLNEKLDPKIRFTCNFRVARQFLNERVFGALRRANVKTLEIGLESGSERLRCQVLRRHYSNDEFFQAVALARSHGMTVNVYNMIGLPGETLADHLETVRVNQQVCPSRSMTSIFYPYPGTDLFETCKAQGLLAGPSNVTAERYRATLNLPAFSKAEIQRAFDWFEYRVFRGHHPWHYRLRKVVRNKAYSSAWAHFVFMRLLPLWHALRERRSGV